MNWIFGTDAEESEKKESVCLSDVVEASATEEPEFDFGETDANEPQDRLDGAGDIEPVTFAISASEQNHDIVKELLKDIKRPSAEKMKAIDMMNQRDLNFICHLNDIAPQYALKYESVPNENFQAYQFDSQAKFPSEFQSDFSYDEKTEVISHGAPEKCYNPDGGEESFSDFQMRLQNEWADINSQPLSEMGREICSARNLAGSQYFPEVNESSYLRETRAWAASAPATDERNTMQFPSRQSNVSLIQELSELRSQAFKNARQPMFSDAVYETELRSQAFKNARQPMFSDAVYETTFNNEVRPCVNTLESLRKYPRINMKTAYPGMNL